MRQFTMRLAAAELRCDLSGRTIKTGERYWRSYERDLPAANYHLSQTPQIPELADATFKRNVLRPLTKKDIRDLCYALNIGTGHGEKRWVRMAPKAELVKVLTGEKTFTQIVPTLGEKATEQAEHESIDPDDVQELVDAALRSANIPTLVAEALKTLTPTEIVVKRIDGTKVKAGVQHRLFPILLDSLSAGCNVFLVGPAGSGKTRAAAEVAKCLHLPFYAESVSQQTPVSVLKGYMDAHGKYVSTNFRKAFEDGGLFLLDELDAGNPNVITALNAAVSVDPGQAVSFPDTMVKRAEKFLCVAAGNTFGHGADREYVGRNPLDAASLDRFVIIEWDYDEELEKAICTAAKCDPKWVAHVQKVRRIAGELKIRLIVSPRASIYGGKMLQVGREWAEVEKMVIWKGLDSGSVEKITERMRLSA